MFKKTGKNSGLGPLSIIGADVRIVGDIVTEGEMQIDGHLQGDITCKTLIIGQSAHIKGEITADTVRIHGEVSGKLMADTVIVGRSGRVTGDIYHDRLEIESGAQVEGHFLRKEAAPPPLALSDQSQAGQAPAAPAGPNNGKAEIKADAAKGGGNGKGNGTRGPAPAEVAEEAAAVN